jgi:hypothetical protein
MTTTGTSSCIVCEVGAVCEERIFVIETVYVQCELRAEVKETVEH